MEEVLRRVARGSTNREIAEQIHVGVVGGDLPRAPGSEARPRRTDLIRYALQKGLLSPEEAIRKPVCDRENPENLQFSGENLTDPVILPG